MLDKIRKFFSSLMGNKNDGQVSLDVLSEDLRVRIVQNKLHLEFNEDLITSVEEEIEDLKEDYNGLDNTILKRCALRTIRSLKDRMVRLSRCSTVYNDNINLHSEMAERLEEMRAEGMKTVSSEILEEVALDHDELYQKHRDIVVSIKSLSDVIEPSDPDLDELAKELGLE